MWVSVLGPLLGLTGDPTPSPCIAWVPCIPQLAWSPSFPGLTSAGLSPSSCSSFSARARRSSCGSEDNNSARKLGWMTASTWDRGKRLGPDLAGSPL